MRIGFIGAGSMASAIARGAVGAGLDGSEMLFTDAHGVHAPALAEATGGTVAASNADLVLRSDYVVLAVKPHLQTPVIEQIRQAVADHRGVCVLSIAAGRTLTAMERDFGAPVPLARAMPNVNAQIGQSMTGFCANERVTDAQVADIRTLLDSVGRSIAIDEADFPVFSALAGCSPAWVFEIIDGLARAGVKHGLRKQQAVAIAAQALVGSATLVLEAAGREGTPGQLIDQVTSPGGTTIAGLLAAEEAGLSTSLVKAVDAAVARDRELC
jgi:pyrroline-5-carboxylate reductase